jgi:nucleotide-binding universal stress UspA family protein
MIAGIRSLYAVAACSGEEQSRSSALSYAVNFAASAGAHLRADSASIRLVLPSAAGSSTIAGLVGAENKRIAGIAAARAATSRSDAEAAGVACSAESTHGFHGEVMARVARLSRVADLTIVDASQSALESARSLAEAALFDGGRSVLIVPAGVESFRCESMIIAWDGSAMASRAVASALPLLRAAKQVEVVSIVGEKDLSGAVPGADLAAHLAHHDVRVDLKDLPVGTRSAADLLREQASMLGADMIVMGAFKHSRLRQWMLGGVTASMLGESATPVLMSH